MTAVFPDSGVPPYEARNSILNPWTVNCSNLWYSTARCEPRFDPAAANAMLSELINAVNCAGIPYDCNKLNNLCDAILKMIQNGGSNCLYLDGGTTDYWGNLNPALLGYPANCCMLLKVIPNIRNTGPVRISINGLGYVAVLRNDGNQLESGDILGGVPFLAVYCNGVFYMAGLSSSQVPIIVKGGIDIWIRWDGSDVTGDGSANHPAKAFRTIWGAWNAVGSRYAATPLFSINMRLGIPGDYEAGGVSNFGGQVTLTGDPYNFQAYRILSRQDPEHVYALICSNALLWISGINMVMRHSSMNANSNNCLRVGNGSLHFGGPCQMTMEASAPHSRFMLIEAGSWFGTGNSVDVYFEGNGLTNTYGVTMNLASASYGASPGFPAGHWHWANINFAGCAYAIGDQAVLRNGNVQQHIHNTTGVQYDVSSNGVFDRVGQPVAGSLPGRVSSQGQVF
jgi:hypothetical protein